MPADQQERILDDSYKSVFILNETQLKAHVCAKTSEDNPTKPLAHVRIRREGDNIITESSNNKVVLSVVESLNTYNLGRFPLDVNPSETVKTILKDGQAHFLPSSLMVDIAKSIPKREKCRKQTWQQTAVVSVTDTEISVGTADKQGEPTLQTHEKPDVPVFAPIEKVPEQLAKLGAVSASAHISFDHLKQLVDALEHTATQLLKLEMWKANDPISLKAVDPRGNPPGGRQVSAVLLPQRQRKDIKP